MQVVELPREKPERALELFADMPGLRLLIIGGDGTVGWVLSCLDALQVAVDWSLHSTWNGASFVTTHCGCAAGDVFVRPFTMQACFQLGLSGAADRFVHCAAGGSRSAGGCKTVAAAPHCCPPAGNRCAFCTLLVRCSHLLYASL